MSFKKLSLLIALCMQPVLWGTYDPYDQTSEAVPLTVYIPSIVEIETNKATLPLVMTQVNAGESYHEYLGGTSIDVTISNGSGSTAQCNVAYSNTSLPTISGGVQKSLLKIYADSGATEVTLWNGSAAASATALGATIADGNVLMQTFNITYMLDTGSFVSDVDYTGTITFSIATS